CEPVESVRAQGEEIRLLADRRELGPAQHLDRPHSLEKGKIQLHALDKAGQIGYDEYALVLVAADEGQDLVIIWIEKLQAAPSEGPKALAQGDEMFHPPQQGVGVV